NFYPCVGVGVSCDIRNTSHIRECLTICTNPILPRWHRKKSTNPSPGGPTIAFVPHRLEYNFACVRCDAGPAARHYSCGAGAWEVNVALTIVAIVIRALVGAAMITSSDKNWHIQQCRPFT